MSNRKVKIDWDRVWVHGQHPDAKYIRWKDNSEVLPVIAPLLRQAYQKRKEMYQEPLRNALVQAVAFLRTFIYKKYGVTPYLKKD